MVFRLRPFSRRHRFRAIGLCLLAFALWTLLGRKKGNKTATAATAPASHPIQRDRVAPDIRVLPASCPDSPSSSLVTLVTSYFELAARNKTKKHTQKEYHDWHKSFFPAICTPMVIFTTPSEYPRISALRSGKPTKFHFYDSVWEVPWIKRRGNETHTLQDIYTEQRKIDWHAGAIKNSPELYAVFNSKTWMVEMTAEENPFNSSYFFWMDSGCVRLARRTLLLHHFPEPEKVIEVFEDPVNPWRRDRLHVLVVHSMSTWMPGMKFKLKGDMMETLIGGFFGGRRETVIKFSRKFSALHDKFLVEGAFVGVEQALYNWMFYNIPEDFMVTAANDLPEARNRGGYDVWLFFQLWYGKDSDPTWKKAKVQNVTDYLKSHSDVYAERLFQKW